MSTDLLLDPEDVLALRAGLIVHDGRPSDADAQDLAFLAEIRHREVAFLRGVIKGRWTARRDGDEWVFETREGLEMGRVYHLERR